MRLLLIMTLLVTAIGNAYARPARWCGWYARHNLVMTDPGENYNLACNWRHYGHAAWGPSEGVIVVWCSHRHHHVGKIVGPCEGTVCLVKSGNDGHAVRVRMRDVAGASLRTE